MVRATFVQASMVLILLLGGVRQNRADAESLYASIYNQRLGNIIAFDANGNPTTFATNPTNPNGLAFGTSGNLYVAGNANDITIFSST